MGESERKLGASNGAAIGVDVGGTKCLGILWSDGAVVAEARRTTPQDPMEMIGAVTEVIEELSGLRTSPVPIGLGMPGLVTRRGVVRASPNLPEVVELPVGDLVSSRLGRAVSVDNDATCAAVAEWRAGAGRSTDDMVLVTLGTGIGAGIVAGGSVIRGTQGFAGEIGHMVVDPDGPPCPCGQRGCWERYASGSALAARAVEMSGVGHPWTGEDLARSALDGDQRALGIFRDFARWLARGLANITNIFDPDVIVVGGGVAREAALFIDDARADLADFVYASQRRNLPRILVAEWDERAGAVGAALLAGADLA
ncbi:MAG: ROK family protein [Actinomycetota bacterium]